MTKLLAINFGGLGDEILFLPTLKSIRNLHPNWHITLLCEPRSKSIVELTNLIDENITFDIKKKPLRPQDLAKLLLLLRNGNFDVVVSSGSSYMVCLLLFLSSIKTRIGYDSGTLSKLLLSHAQPLNKNQYAGGMYHDLTKGFGIQGKASIPEVIISEERLAQVQKSFPEIFSDTANGVNPSAASKPYRVIIHPGTSKLALQKGLIKTWQVENWVHLISKLLDQKNIKVILAGGPDDDEIIPAITSKLPENKENFVLVYGRTKNVADLAALIKLSDLLVCLDSAPMHIGVGLNKPLIAMFGPTDPAKLLPAEKHFIALTNNNNSESQTGTTIDPELVFQFVLKQLQLIPPSLKH